MISYNMRKRYPQISEMWVKVAARLALAGDAFSLADAVEGAWLSGEAASGFTSVSSSMIGRKVIDKISNWSLFWAYYSMALLDLNMLGIWFFCYIDRLVFWKKCLGLLLNSMFTAIASLAQTYECRFPTRCLKKALEPWDSDTFVILALKSFSQIYKSIAITWET